MSTEAREQELKEEKTVDGVEENEASENDVENTETTEESENEENADPEAEASDAEAVTVEAELAEAKDKYLRLYSEFDNYRRRTAKEKLELIKTATETLMKELIPVVDDFERAQSSVNEESEVKSILEGQELIYNKFQKVLDKSGLEKIETNKGDDFNDEIHEAITQFPAPEESLKGKIIDVVEQGYKLGDKVIRFAKVVTGS